MALGALGQSRDALFAPRRGQHLEGDRPIVKALFVVGHLDPEDRASGLAHHLSESIHRRHNIARRRHDGVADLIIHESVLQVDYDQRGAHRIELGKAMLAAAPPDNPLYDLTRDGGAIEFHISSLFYELRP